MLDADVVEEEEEEEEDEVDLATEVKSLNSGSQRARTSGWEGKMSKRPSPESQQGRGS